MKEIQIDITLLTEHKIAKNHVNPFWEKKYFNDSCYINSSYNNSDRNNGILFIFTIKSKKEK
jgi:hypothetical protein